MSSPTDSIHSDKMDFLYNQLDCYHPIILIVVILIGNQFKSILKQKSRLKLAEHQRRQHLATLAREKLIEEQELTKQIESMQAEIKELESQLCDEVDDSKRPLKQLGIKLDSVDDLKRAIDNHRRERDSLTLIEEEVAKTLDRIDLKEPSDEELIERIKALDDQRQSLENQIVQYKGIRPPKETDPREDILAYLEEHKELTIDDINNTYEKLLEFGDQVDPEILNTPSNYDNDLMKLESMKITAQKSLDQKRRHYQEELSYFRETRIEHLFKNTGAQELLVRLRERNELMEELFQGTKSKEPGLVNGDYLEAEEEAL